MNQDYIVFGQPLIGDAEINAVTDVLRSGWIGTGPKVKQFEDQFAAYTGAKYAVAVNSCTAALHLSFLASGIEPGDEVITTPLTFAATVNAILHVGAVPVFVDVDPVTMNIDPAGIQSVITEKTRAILPVHFAGLPCDMARIESIARKHGLLIIEDAAHCIEGASGGRKVGTIGHLTCFSFYVTKNLTTAEGGMVTTDNLEYAEKIRRYALHGLSSDAWHRFQDKGYRHYEVVFPGYKYNMTDIQAAIGCEQLTGIDERLAVREAIWQEYNAAFAECPCILPVEAAANDMHARHLYTLLIDSAGTSRTRDEVMADLHSLGVGTGVHYRAIHLHPYYRQTYGFKPEDYINANSISNNTLSLPLSANLSSTQIAKVIDSVRQVLI